MRLRVNLERLLRSCEQLSGSLNSRTERRRFETYLSVLDRQWQELAATRHCSDEVLGEFRRKINRLAELLDGGKMLSTAGNGLALAQAQSNANLSRTQANVELSNRLREQERMQEELKLRLLNLGDGGAAASCSGGGGPPRARRAAADAAPPPGGVEAASLEDTLKTEREQQDVLYEDISRSVAQLRDRSRQAGQAVRDDSRTLDTIDTMVDDNQNELNVNHGHLRTAIGKVRAGSCWTCLVVLLVVFLFVAIFMLMKLFPKSGTAAPPPVINPAET